MRPTLRRRQSARRRTGPWSGRTPSAPSHSGSGLPCFASGRSGPALMVLMPWWVYLMREIQAGILGVLDDDDASDGQRASGLERPRTSSAREARRVVVCAADWAAGPVTGYRAGARWPARPCCWLGRRSPAAPRSAGALAPAADEAGRVQAVL